MNDPEHHRFFPGSVHESLAEGIILLARFFSREAVAYGRHGHRGGQAKVIVRAVLA